MADLLNCPFCGGEAELEETEREDHYSAPRPHRVYIIECCACEANIKEISRDWWSGSTPPPESENDLKAKSDVIAAWNRRATHHVSDEAVEAAIPKHGDIPFDVLGRDVNDAMTGQRTDFDFGDRFPGHVLVGTINFNSLNRIASKYALSHTGKPTVKAQECATEGCNYPATVYFERGGVGSYYCHNCYLRVQALPTGSAKP